MASREKSIRDIRNQITPIRQGSMGNTRRQRYKNISSVRKENSERAQMTIARNSIITKLLKSRGISGGASKGMSVG